MLSRQEPWLMSSVDLAAKLQACEIELECTRQEVVKKDIQLQQFKSTLDYKEKQIKTQARRQHDIERIHKELIQEYEQQVVALRKEIESIKHSQEQVHSNYLELQSKYTSQQRNCDASRRLLDVIDELDRRLQNSSTVLPSPGPHSVTSGGTADILKENCYHLQEKLKTIQLGRPQKQDSLDLLQEEVLHSLTVTRHVMDQLMTLEASIRSLKEPGNLDEYIDSSGQRGINRTKTAAAPPDTSPLPQWFNEWSAHLNSAMPNAEVSLEENGYVEDLKEKISIHVNTLECLIGRIVQKQLLRNLMSNS